MFARVPETGQKSAGVIQCPAGQRNACHVKKYAECVMNFQTLKARETVFAEMNELQNHKGVKPDIERQRKTFA